MLKEEKALRGHLRGALDGMLTKISEKGQPDKYQSSEVLTRILITALVHAVREDCAKVADQMELYTGVDVADAIRLRKGGK